MNSQDIIKTAVDASPPAAYITLHLFGVSLPDWVALATLIYLVLQTAHLVWRWTRASRRRGTEEA